MKKIIVAAALAAGLLCTTGVSAKNPNARNLNRQVATCAQTADSCTGQRPDGAPRFNPFEGITLTTEQQTAIDNLQNQRRQARETARRDGRQERDQRQQAARENGQQERRDYLNQIKGILTPEQYVTFLENSFLNAPGPRDRDGHRGHDMRREGRDRREARRVQGNRVERAAGAAVEAAATQATSR